MKKIVVGLLLAITIASNVSATDYDSKIADLEHRISILEKIISLPKYKEPTALSGIYVVGEDIDPGTYSFKVIEGGTGSITVFSSYDSYIQNNGNQFLAIYYENLRNENYNVDTSSDEWDDYFEGYLSEVKNANLKKNMCVAIKGVTVVASKKNSRIVIWDNYYVRRQTIPHLLGLWYI